MQNKRPAEEQKACPYNCSSLQERAPRFKKIRVQRLDNEATK
jgi:hypothetical protein